MTPRERELMEALRKALQIPRADATRVEEAVKEGSDDKRECTLSTLSPQ